MENLVVSKMFLTFAPVNAIDVCISSEMKQKTIINLLKSMRMKRCLILLLVLGFLGGVPTVKAQFLERLGEALRETAEDAVERNMERSVEKSINKAFDKDTYEKAKDKVQDKVNEKANEKLWTCKNCGFQENIGKFCSECGTPKPSDGASWKCEACGYKGNTGKFCIECGTKKDEKASASSTSQ